MKLAATLLVALVLRLAWMLHAAPVPVSDFAGYRSLAEGLLDTGQLGAREPTAYRLPGYPAFLAAAMVFGRSLPWLRLVNVLLSTAAVALVHRIARRATDDERVALVAAALCAVNPTFVFFSPILASEHLFAILVLGACAASIGGREGSRSAPALAGALLGAGALTRGEGLFYLPVFALAAGHGAPDRRRRIGAALALAGACLFVVSPWYVRNRLVLGPGAGLSTSGGVNFYMAHNPSSHGFRRLAGTPLEDLDEVERQRAGYRLGLAHLARGGLPALVGNVPAATTSLLFERGSYAVEWSATLPRDPSGGPYRKKHVAGEALFARSTRFYFALLAGAVLSLAFTAMRARARLLLYGIVAANWIGYAWIFWAKPRYRFVPELVFCVLAAFTCVELARRLRVVSRVSLASGRDGGAAHARAACERPR